MLRFSNPQGAFLRAMHREAVGLISNEDPLQTMWLARFGMSDGGVRDYWIGLRLDSAVKGDPGFEINLDATRRESDSGNEAPEHGVMLRSAIRW